MFSKPHQTLTESFHSRWIVTLQQLCADDWSSHWRGWNILYAFFTLWIQMNGKIHRVWKCPRDFDVSCHLFHIRFFIQAGRSLSVWISHPSALCVSSCFSFSLTIDESSFSLVLAFFHTFSNHSVSAWHPFYVCVTVVASDPCYITHRSYHLTHTRHD